MKTVITIYLLGCITNLIYFGIKTFNKKWMKKARDKFEWIYSLCYIPRWKMVGLVVLTITLLSWSLPLVSYLHKQQEK